MRLHRCDDASNSRLTSRAHEAAPAFAMANRDVRAMFVRAGCDVASVQLSDRCWDDDARPLWGIRWWNATARCKRRLMNAASDRDGQIGQMRLDEGEGRLLLFCWSDSRPSAKGSANQQHSDTLNPGKAIATSMHNYNDMLKKPPFLHSGESLEIPNSCRNSRRQVFANFRESPGTPKALIRALFSVVLLIAAGDQMQERCGSKSLTVFDKFMS